VRSVLLPVLALRLLTVQCTNTVKQIMHSLITRTSRNSRINRCSTSRALYTKQSNVAKRRFLHRHHPKSTSVGNDEGDSSLLYTKQSNKRHLLRHRPNSTSVVNDEGDSSTCLNKTTTNPNPDEADSMFHLSNHQSSTKHIAMTGSSAKLRKE
jgi:hypothetical protein